MYVWSLFVTAYHEEVEKSSGGWMQWRRKRELRLKNGKNLRVYSVRKEIRKWWEWARGLRERAQKIFETIFRKKCFFGSVCSSRRGIRKWWAWAPGAMGKGPKNFRKIFFWEEKGNSKMVGVNPGDPRKGPKNFWKIKKNVFERVCSRERGIRKLLAWAPGAPGKGPKNFL